MCERPRVALLAIGLAISLLVVGCSSGKPAAGGTATTTTARRSKPTTASRSTSTSGTVSAKGPKAGACLEPMTGPIAEGNQLPAIVPCSDPHGGEIVHTYQIPDGPASDYPASNAQIIGADSTVAECAGDATHLGAFGAFVGDDAIAIPAALGQATGVTQAWTVSGLQAGLFVPGPAAWAHGERWLACAAVLTNSQDVPSSYTGSAKGVRATPGEMPTQFSWCKEEADSNNPSTFQTVSCTKGHNYQQVASFSAGLASASFPGEPALDQEATKLCAPLVSAATAGKSDHLAATLGISWTFPQQADWTSGSRVVRCFVTTRSGDSSGAVGTKSS
jgi:hypothetical protein